MLPLNNKAYSLRVSVLEQCQYRCPYCLPGSVKAFTHKKNWLTADEYGQMAQLFQSLNISQIRFTGGEPLLRKDLPEIVNNWRAHFPHANLAFTTNGQLLLARAADLAQAGLKRINIHIDTLRPERYQALMGDGDLQDVLLAVRDAKSRFEQVKVNVVVQKGKNDDELVNFLDWSQEIGVEVRFIELMNTGSARDYIASVFMAGHEMIAAIGQERTVVPLERRKQSDPARLFLLPDTNVIFGLIASDTEPFCADCNRLRLTADGRLRGCMYESGGVALGQMLKNGQPLEELKTLLLGAVENKKSFHPMLKLERNWFSMAEIGG